ncbi:MAG: B12-binding domain-containing radical SAM protein [Sedimentisphaerales bacterium]|nr:B12-binding domain-containing radical SAM protein [Sedimentisphaerales bacterium]
MKILFVRPRYDDGFGMKPISISILSALAKKAGFETSLFDAGNYDHEFGSYHYLKDLNSVKLMKPVDFSRYNFQKEKMKLEEAIIRKLESFNPDIVAVSVISGQHILAEKISRYIKEYKPAVKIIWGGPHVTVAPYDALHQGADYICVGEGLTAFDKFINVFSRGGDLSSLNNIWSLNNNKPNCNNLASMKESLDDLPYLDWSIFGEKDFLKPYDGEVLRGGDHMVTWGCPNKCSYCINEYYQNLYRDNHRKFVIRRYSPERIISELKYLKDTYKLEFLKFCDENFLLTPVEYLKDFADKYAKEVNIPFTTACHPRLVTEEKIDLLKKAGCASLSIGIETGDAEYRKNILNRTDSIDDVVRAFHMAKNAGIRTMAFNMLGLPFYSRDIYDKTIELNRRSQAQYSTASFFYPFKGTKLREVAIKNKFYVSEMDVNCPMLRMGTPSLVFNEFDADELKEMFSVFGLYIKLPENYRKYIQRSEITDSIGLRLRNKLIEIYENTVWKNDGWFIDDGNEDSYIDELEHIMEEDTPALSCMEKRENE